MPNPEKPEGKDSHPVINERSLPRHLQIVEIRFDGAEQAEQIVTRSHRVLDDSRTIPSIRPLPFGNVE